MAKLTLEEQLAKLEAETKAVKKAIKLEQRAKAKAEAEAEKQRRINKALEFLDICESYSVRRSDSSSVSLYEYCLIIKHNQDEENKRKAEQNRNPNFPNGN